MTKGPPSRQYLKLTLKVFSSFTCRLLAKATPSRTRTYNQAYLKCQPEELWWKCTAFLPWRRSFDNWVFVLIVLLQWFEWFGARQISTECLIERRFRKFVWRFKECHSKRDRPFDSDVGPHDGRTQKLYYTAVKSRPRCVRSSEPEGRFFDPWNNARARLLYYITWNNNPRPMEENQPCMRSWE